MHWLWWALIGAVAAILAGRFVLVSPHWQRSHGKRRFWQVRDWVEGASLLDVGAAEGWIGQAAAGCGHSVQLVDVVDLNQTRLPLLVYDGTTLPFADASFDTIMILLVLHHCEDPESVLREAMRVSRRRVLVTESVYRTRLGKWLLAGMDAGFNVARSGGRMSLALNLNTVEQWRRLFCRCGLEIEHEAWLSRGLHRQRFFVLRAV